MSFFKAFVLALRAERIRARRKWLERDRVVKQRPKYDPRSSIEMHRRIVGETPAILKPQAY